MAEPPTTDNEAPPVTNYSLQPNGETYVDRDNESAQIFSRIANSSSSVVGISGVRGAGKSSLALKIKDNCTNHGFFTLWISSPLEHEPFEYFLSILERLCIGTNELIDQKIGKDQSLISIASAEARRLWFWVTGLVVLGIALVSFPAYQAFYLADLERRKERLVRIDTDISEYYQSVQANATEFRSEYTDVTGEPDLPRFASSFGEEGPASCAILGTVRQLRVSAELDNIYDRIGDSVIEPPI